MADKCDVCGHETSVLDHGTGKYAEKMVCGLCEDRNFREQLLRVEINKLNDDRMALGVAITKCIAEIDKQVEKGECNETYSLIRNTLNDVLVYCGFLLEEADNRKGCDVGKVISREKFNEVWASYRERYSVWRFFDEEDRVRESLMMAGIEVEEPPEPPVMPEGLSEGTWTPEPQSETSALFAVVTESGEHIAMFATEANSKFMAGSKKVTEAVIAWLEMVNLAECHPKLGLVIDAIEKQGCEVTKFRDETEIGPFDGGL